MKKVLHIITDTNIGGAGRYLLTLLSQPAFAEVDVAVACPEGELSLRLEAAGIERLDISGKDISFSLPLTMQLLRLIKRQKPCIVHTHSCLSGRIAAKVLGIPVVYTKHGFDTGKSVLGKRKQTGIVKRRLNRTVSMFLSDSIIAISDGVLNELVESGVDPSRITCILNGVDLSEFRPKSVAKTDSHARHHREPSKTVLIGTLARLHPVKALDVLVEAAKITLASFPDARFLIGGTGPMEQALRERIQDLRLEPFVKLVGFVEDVPAFLSEIDIFALSSDSEGLGLVILEAMAHGLPVVATEVGGVPEAVKDRETGFLVPARNARLIAQSIVRLAIDPDLASRMGANGRKRAEEYFDARVMAEKTLDLYKSLE